MAGYDYTYQSYSTYNTLGSETDEPLGPAMRRSFVPFVPNTNTRKTVVPVATRPQSDDEYRAHGSPTKAYPPPMDYSHMYRQTSPVHSRPQNEPSRAARFSPVAASDWRHSPHPTGYNSDYGTNREEHWPVGSPVRNDNNYHGNGYVGDYGNYNDKERHKPIGSSIRNDNYDRYQRPGWTAPPRNGTQLSEPTNDIGKALGLLKEAAKLSGDCNNRGRPKDHEGYNSNYNYQRRHDDVDRTNPSIWAEPPGNSGSHFREPSKIDKETERLRNMHMSEPTLSPHKGDTSYSYREPMDATRRYGIFNFKSRPRTSPNTHRF